MHTGDKKYICKNCGGKIDTEGHIHWPLIPSLALVLGGISRKGFCGECASRLNGIGVLATIIVFIVLIVGLGMLAGWNII